MLISCLRLPSLVTDPSPFSPRHLQSSSDSQYMPTWSLREWDPNWKRGLSAEAAGSRPASWQ